jgi:hypothetical protein
MFLSILFNSILNFSIWAIPHNIVIDSKLIYKGRQISSPRITTIEGRKAYITENDLYGRTRLNLELKPISSIGRNVKMEYSLLLKEAHNEFHSHGILNLSGDQMGMIYLDKGRIQIQLKVNR